MKKLLLLLPLAYACVDPHAKRNGTCVAIQDCDHDWSFGTTEKPICDVPGADYTLPTTKICCLETGARGTPEAQPEEPEPEPESKEPESKEPEEPVPEEPDVPVPQEPEAPAPAR